MPEANILLSISYILIKKKNQVEVSEVAEITRGRSEEAGVTGCCRDWYGRCHNDAEHGEGGETRAGN